MNNRSFFFPALSLAGLFWPVFCLGCGRALEKGFLCPDCLADLEFLPPALDFSPPLFAPARYRRPLSEAVRRLKYGGETWLARPMGELVARLVPPDFLAGGDFLVPVPLHHSRRRERGCNQAELLASAIARRGGPPVRADLLRRVKTAVPQARLAGPARGTGVAGAFQVTPPASVRGRRCLIVDDVVTTGATLRACREALEKAGAASVAALVFARAFD